MLVVAIIIIVLLIITFIVTFVLYQKTPSPIKEEKCENCPLKQCINNIKGEDESC